MSVIPRPPIHPDFYQCSDDWNGPPTPPALSGLGAIDFTLKHTLTPVWCLRAADALLGGWAKQEYTVGGTGAFSLPFQKSKGDCRVLVELASPNDLQGEIISLSPNTIRGMAFWVIAQCVLQSDGVLGGFITQDFRNVTDYNLDPRTDFQSSFPPTVRFLTVTVDGGDAHPPLGDYGEAFVNKIAGLVGQKQVDATGTDFVHWSQGTDVYRTALLNPLIGRPWWPNSASYQTADTSIYECDANLGTPSASGCSQIDYSELGPSSDMLTLAPGLPKILASNDCALSIKSDSFVTMTWEAVKTALAVIQDICIDNPILSVKGGRAYVGSSPSVGKRAPASNTPFYDVVPPGVTVTLYEPGHFDP